MTEDKIDELISETKKSRRISVLQLAAVIVAAIPGIVGSVLQSTPAVVVTSSAVVVAAIIFFSVFSPGGSNSQWYDWITARERLRFYSESMKANLGYSGTNDLYISALRMHYQFALVEGRKELAQFLSRELDLATKTKTGNG